MTTSPSPKRIELEGSALALTWRDGSSCQLPLQTLRDDCPCAGCKGETILGRHYPPAKLPVFTPGMYELADIRPVGSYAIQLFWKDGHTTGIYSWAHLRELCARPVGRES